ncbi:EAL domain-containing protein [Lysinibacillus yapensis]|uniref:EAL domain-containing protein n=1 Tax=Ureibacillus yapensis TaxID=2304605 RepID=A0A396SFR3_9BACL|nr:bifunctional diguanylate cyclase/phosphodiesterase [Lysinibacillus yapensis]RHW40125.1 EAL domain-containing protein [Lysinibacillus yapensis]
MNRFEKQQQVEMQERIDALLKIDYALDKSAIVAITNPQGEILFVNDLFCETAQYSREELIGQNHRILNSGYHSKEFFKNMYKTIGSGEIWRGEIRNKKKNGSFYWVQATIVPFLNEKGKPEQYISIRSDITKEKLLEEEVIQSNEKYRLIAENSVNLIALIEPDGRFNYVSPSFKNILNYDLATLETSNLFDLVHFDERGAFAKKLKAFLKKKKCNFEREFRLKCSNGEYIIVEASISHLDNDKDSSDQVLIVMKDITGRKETEKRIFHLAYHDALTNFPNRRSFMSQLRNDLMERKKSKEKMSILMIDLDNFKSINEQIGHDNGDLVIQQAASNIKESIRPTDMVARMGGDEFIILLKDVEQEETVMIVQRILSKFNSPITVNGNDFIVSCSIGVAHYPVHGQSPEELIRNADSALSIVKSGTKNNYQVFDQTIENQSLERRLLESALRSALKEEQFFLEFQPKINIETNKIIGAESLVRWHHHDLGTIPPGKFISLAEETGLIVPMGEWILRESCRQVKAWQNEGFPDFVVSVNVSVRQLEDPDFIEKVKRILEETSLSPMSLELEVTESIFADVRNTVSILEEIQKLGIQVSVDDFGTGYSSLSYIKNLPINTLKIDQSFVRDLHTNEESNAIIMAIVNIANSVGLNVIAEGVEMEEQANLLVKNGCKLAQGYFYSKPLKKDDFEKILQVQ